MSVRPETPEGADGAGTQQSQSSSAPGGAPAGGIRGAVAAGLSGEALTATSLLGSLGGVRGILESLLPGFVFLAVFTFTQSPTVSVIAPLVMGVGAIVARAVQRQTVQPAVIGLLGIAVCAATTLFTGRAEDFYAPGLIINLVYGSAMIISLLVGWPLLGFVIGALRNDFTGWRRDPRLKRAALIATGIWAALFVARLLVQYPLYLAGNAELLGVARLVMGTPLFALVILATWLIFRAASATGSAAVLAGDSAPGGGSQDGNGSGSSGVSEGGNTPRV